MAPGTQKIKQQKAQLALKAHIQFGGPSCQALSISLGLSGSSMLLPLRSLLISFMASHSVQEAVVTQSCNTSENLDRKQDLEAGIRIWPENSRRVVSIKELDLEQQKGECLELYYPFNSV